MLREAIRTVHAGNAVLAPSDLTALLTADFAPPRTPPTAFAELTDKEREIFLAVARGLSDVEVGEVVFASESTVKTHVGAILRKLRLRDRVQIVVYAHEHGLLDRSSSGAADRPDSQRADGPAFGRTLVSAQVSAPGSSGTSTA